MAWIQCFAESNDKSTIFSLFVIYYTAMLVSKVTQHQHGGNGKVFICDRNLTVKLTLHLPRKTDEFMKKTQNSQYPSQDSN
jgi:hypothetical protein